MSETLLDPDFLNILSTLSLKLRCQFHGSQTRANKRGNSIDFGGYRSYSLGEDLRYVDWNIYARLEQLFVKEFEAEEIFKVVLYLDRSPSMDYGKQNKLWFAKKLCALLGYLTLIEGNQLILVSSSQPVSFSGSKNILNFLQHLQQLTPLSEDFSKVPLFNHGRGRSLGIILSDLYTLDPTTNLGILGKIHYQMLTLHLVDSMERGPFGKGLIQFQDLETKTQLRLNFTQKLANYYKKKFEEHLKQRESTCHSLGSSYLLLETQTKFDISLGLKLFKTGVFQ